MANFVKSDLQMTVFEAVLEDNKTLSDAVREKILEVCGGEWNAYRFKANKELVFEVIAEMMPAATQAGLAGVFDQWIDFHDTAMGDEPAFWVEDNTIYPLVTSSRGNGDIDRQKITDSNFKVPTNMKAIKFYDELDRFMAGKMDIARLSDKAVEAHINDIGQMASDAIYNSYSAVDTKFKGTGTFDATSMVAIMENVKAATGAERLQILGSVTALRNVSDIFGYSDNEKEMANGMGYYGTFNGADMIALKQAYRPGTETFGLSTNYVIVVPADEKLVKVLFEGTPVIEMQSGLDRNDMQTELYYGRRVGASALTVPEGKFGLWRFS